MALVVFLAIASFVRTPLPKMPAFFPAYQSALFFIDLITAALLIDQYLRVCSTALLVLAAGYLFDALTIISHTLTFPGAFAPTGFLKAGGTDHGMAMRPLAWRVSPVRHRVCVATPHGRTRGATSDLQALALVVAVVGVTVFTSLATWGHDLLPVVMQGSNYSQLVSKGVSPAVWLVTLSAIAMLWQRDLRVIERWLMLVMWIWLFVGHSWFQPIRSRLLADRLFGLIAASFLLLALSIELARMYNRAAGTAGRRELDADTSAPARDHNVRETPVMATASFIHDNNIAHYRSLLESDKLSDAEGRIVRCLLASACSVRPIPSVVKSRLPSHSQPDSARKSLFGHEAEQASWRNAGQRIIMLSERAKDGTL